MSDPSNSDSNSDSDQQTKQFYEEEYEYKTALSQNKLEFLDKVDEFTEFQSKYYLIIV